MSIVVRFAPSPTGLLHVGNARTALLNFLFAKKHGGKFLLRIDDTDAERSKPEFEDAILDDLNWLGLERQIYSRQAPRVNVYRDAFRILGEAGYLYPCFETPQELERKRKRQIASGKPPVYDRAAMGLTPDDREKLKAAGRRPHWRFMLSHKKVQWHDLVRGDVEIDTAHLSDPVLVREDETFLYTLPSVVDDIQFGVSHIIRGEDHVTNTAVQIELFRAFGAPVPEFAHFPLLIGAGGEALSKRVGSLSLRSLREDGIEPLALASYLAKTGTSDAIALAPDLDALARDFDFAKIGRAPAHFDPAELSNLNAKLLHGLPYEAAAGRLSALGIAGGEAFWEAVKPNLMRFADAAGLWTLVAGPVTPVIEDRALADTAARLLPPGPIGEETWPAWTGAVAAATGRKGRALFHPLRLALTGREHGPELRKLLPLIGRERVLARLKGETA